jgi:hypothetical protein
VPPTWRGDSQKSSFKGKDYVSGVTYLDRTPDLIAHECHRPNFLWLRGTVRDAVRNFQMFEARSVPAMLHRSRFSVDVRSWLDGVLVSAFGPGGSRRPVVAVTTQTEQSREVPSRIVWKSEGTRSPER